VEGHGGYFHRMRIYHAAYYGALKNTDAEREERIVVLQNYSSIELLF